MSLLPSPHVTLERSFFFFADVRVFCLQNVEDDLVTTSRVKSQNKSAGVFLWQRG